MTPCAKIKNPSSDDGLKGCTQFTWPFFMYCPFSVFRRVKPLPNTLFYPFHLGVKMNIFQGSQSPAIWQGRSSGSPALLATFPSRLVETVVFAAKRVLSLYTTNNKKSRVTAAGPLPTLTGFPIKLTHLMVAFINKMVFFCQENWLCLHISSNYRFNYDLPIYPIPQIVIERAADPVGFPQNPTCN